MPPSIDVRALVRRVKATEKDAEKLARSTHPAEFFARGFIDTRVSRDDGDASSSREIRAPNVPGLTYEREFLGAEDAHELERALCATPREWWRKGDARRVMNAGGVAPSRLFRAGDVDVITEECLNARDMGLGPGDRVKRNPRGRMSVVFVSKRAASEN